MSIQAAGSSPERRHDLDALRAAAMLLGIALHAAIPYAPQFPWAVRDSQTSDGFSLLLISIHGFRMPLFFLISGFFTAMVWRQKGLATLLRQRALRILLPCLLASVTILPLMSWITRQVAPAIAATSVAQPAAAAPTSPPPITTLTEAIRGSDSAKLQELLVANPEIVSVPDAEMQVQPLAWATMHGNSDAARLLLDAGADANGRNGDGSTALHGAVFTGQAEILKLLLERGADPVAKNLRGELPAQAAAADPGATAFIWSLLRLPPRKPEDIANGRNACLAQLPALPPVAPAPPPDLLTGIRMAYTGLLTTSGWQVPALSRPGQPPFHLLFSPVFNHLWFLWFLCWMVAAFAILIQPAKWLLGMLPFPALHTARLLTVSPLKFLFLLPTAALMTLMGLFQPGFGPDTSMGLLPQPHVLCYYSFFFVFGCLYFVADDREGRTGRLWWFSLPLALCVLIPLNSGVRNSQVAVATVQAAYAWLMSFGCLGIFRRFLSRPSPAIRWLSDASYWLYLTHLPLLFVLQAPMRPLEFSAWLKFALATVTCTGLLLVAYQFGVRYTWLGTLLNGPRRKAGASRA